MAAKKASKSKKNQKTKKQPSKKVNVQKRKKLGKLIANISKWVLIIGLLGALGSYQVVRLLKIEMDVTWIVVTSFLAGMLGLVGWGVGLIYQGEISGGLMKTKSSGKDNSLVIGVALILLGILFSIVLLLAIVPNL
jgi:hypothetical protein